MMRLLLVPHAETDWNAQGRYQGHTDVPLSERGRHQAERVAQRLAGENFDVVYASDLRRAWDTAVALVEPHGMSPRAEPRLRELHFGDWEGLTFAEVRHLAQETPSGGETLADLAARLRSFLDDLAQSRSPMFVAARFQRAEVLDCPLIRHAGSVPPQPDGTVSQTPRSCGRTVVLAAHRGSLRVLLCLVLGLPADVHWRFRLDPASLSELELHDETAVLTRLNDVSHLSEVADAG